MSENIPEDKKDVNPKPDSSLSEDDINKLVALLKKKMQVITIITSGATGLITSFLVLITYKTLQPPVIGSNGTLEPSHELSAPAWERNSSLVIFTTKDRTFSFDLESVSQGDSFVNFQKSLMNQFKEDLMDVNRTLSYLQVALTNISEHCDDKTGSLESALKGLTALNQSITGQNLRLDTLNITLLVVQNTSQLLKIDQLELLERLIENNATLHDVIEHLRNLDQSVEQHGQKANKAYDRSLLASAEMYSMGISASWILYSIVIGLLIELPITLFCMKVAACQQRA
ncbi:uncharacterized protein LOC135461601 isoform X1 [Liolophura sinensis]|uniref:uncharacterized protein LOC135461601 isoform X1 n=1 Tax=Liolophura sinensis TaxID=3198878 RepID=UPI0031580E44